MLALMLFERVHVTGTHIADHSPHLPSGLGCWQFIDHCISEKHVCPRKWAMDPATLESFGGHWESKPQNQRISKGTESFKHADDIKWYQMNHDLTWPTWLVLDSEDWRGHSPGSVGGYDSVGTWAGSLPQSLPGPELWSLCAHTMFCTWFS